MNTFTVSTHYLVMSENLWNPFLRYIKSADFFKAYLMAFAIVVPVVIFSHLDLLPVGTAIALGVLLCSPSDVPGNSKHRVNGMFCAILLALIGTLVGGFAAERIWVFMPVIIILVFLFSYISVFGFRASLISFVGLLAFVLSFADFGSQDRWVHLLLIAVGGLWYMLISTLFLWARPRMHAEQLLAETMELTADLMDLKKTILTVPQDREGLIERQFKLQAEITVKHEKLREVLLRNRKHSGKSNPARRKLLIFINLVDILELAVSNPVNFEKMDSFAVQHPQVTETLGNILGGTSLQLRSFAENISNHKRIISIGSVPTSIAELENYIDRLNKENPKPETRTDLLTISNLLEHEKKSQEKIKSIERILANLVVQSPRTTGNKEHKFITPTDYSFGILKENFDFSSPIFRHSLRLVVLFIIGIIVGKLFIFQNAYWIVLTIIVIMRPSYGLTKERSKKRILGTLIGGTIAFAIVFLLQNPMVYGVLAIITFILAFSMIQRNYVTAATFITLNIVFVYALLKPNAFEVIQFRVIDTAIGAGLAFLGNFLLWPSWEYRGIEKVMIASIRANIDYLKKIDHYYRTKQNDHTAYKLARKHAFLEMGNLSAAFQRMAQEPKSVQRELEQLYRFCVLNQTFLSSLAGLGTYIRNHKTTAASVHFEAYVAQIIQHLEITAGRLDNRKLPLTENKESIENANTFLASYMEKLDDKRLLLSDQTKDIEKLELDMREAHLVSEQLKWLYKISLKLSKKDLIF